MTIGSLPLLAAIYVFAFFAQATSSLAGTWHFVTPNGINDAAWPGIHGLSENSYLGFVYDSDTETFYFGFQGERKGNIPEGWYFDRRRGHEDMIMAGMPDYERNDRRFQGGGLIVHPADANGPQRLEFKTRTRSIQGIRREMPQAVNFQNRDARANRSPEYDLNGLLTPTIATALGHMISDYFDLPVTLSHATSGPAANLKLTGFDKEDQLHKRMQAAALKQATESGRAAMRFHYMIRPGRR